MNTEEIERRPGTRSSALAPSALEAAMDEPDMKAYVGPPARRRTPAAYYQRRCNSRERTTREVPMKKGLILGLILGLWASPAAAQIPTNCVTENAGRSWSLTFPATDTLRFELRAGDRWQYDSVGAERTEIDCYKSIFPPGSAINISYEFMWEAAGAANAAQWIIFGQFHNNDNYSNPPAGFITAPRSTSTTVGLSYGTTTSRTAITPWRDTLPLQRGRWYKIQIQANFSPQGFFRVWRGRHADRQLHRAARV